MNVYIEQQRTRRTDNVYSKTLSACTCLLNIISPNFKEVFKPGSLQNPVFIQEIKSAAAI